MEYVVQVLTSADTPDEVWRDAALVSVPARSKRKTILRAAQEAGVTFPATVRILDADAARALRVGFGESAPPPLVVEA